MLLNTHLSSINQDIEMPCYSHQIFCITFSTQRCAKFGISCDTTPPPIQGVRFSACDEKYKMSLFSYHGFQYHSKCNKKNGFYFPSSSSYLKQEQVVGCNSLVITFRKLSKIVPKQQHDDTCNHSKKMVTSLQKKKKSYFEIFVGKKNQAPMSLQCEDSLKKI